MTHWLRIYHPDPAAWTPRIAEATQAIAAAGGRVVGEPKILTSDGYTGAVVFITWKYGRKNRNPRKAT